MGWPAWVGAVQCTDGPQPGVEAFARWVMEEYGDKGAMNWGIYNCRPVRGGGTTSLHGEGRAVDIGFPVGDPDGDDLLRKIRSRPGRLGVQCVIYERRIYSAKSPKGRYYGGAAPHYDHLHVEFTWEAAERLTYATVKRVMGRRRVPKQPPGSRGLSLGDSGPDVRWVQRRLRVTPVDGVYGPITRDAVKRYEKRQKARRYPRMAADGAVGRLTWRSFGVKPTY